MMTRLHKNSLQCDNKVFNTYDGMAGPIGHFFYQGMDKVVTRYFKIGTLGFVLAKVLGDELLFGPVHVGGYFAWMTLAEGGSMQVCDPLFSTDSSCTIAQWTHQNRAVSSKPACRCTLLAKLANANIVTRFSRNLACQHAFHECVSCMPREGTPSLAEQLA